MWNLHRRYGAARLPWMLTDWAVKDIVGWNEDLLTREANWRQTYEPAFVLTPRLPAGSGVAEGAAARSDSSTNKEEV
eukprot:COSAG02_NODE_2490_length_8694_cov_3.602909_4_plen_77_part_00